MSQSMMSSSSLHHPFNLSKPPNSSSCRGGINAIKSEAETPSLIIALLLLFSMYSKSSKHHTFRDFKLRNFLNDGRCCHPEHRASFSLTRFGGKVAKSTSFAQLGILIPP
uniref:Uncharacterized protein n=1 Tax=Opuntia streptacantha TaxID=393608 RepID=A0A7C9EBN7_OPUST